MTIWYEPENAVAQFTQGFLIPVQYPTPYPTPHQNQYPTQVQHCTTKKVRLTCAIAYTMQFIEGTTMFMSSSMRKSVERHLRQTLMEWISKDPVCKVLGPKKCRILMSWLSGNRMNEESAKIVGAFLSWILDTNIDTVLQRDTVMIKIDI